MSLSVNVFLIFFNNVQSQHGNHPIDDQQFKTKAVSIEQVLGKQAEKITNQGRKHCDERYPFVVDGNFAQAYKDLKDLKNQGNSIKIIKYARTFGESNALMECFKQAKGDKILTLASYIQVEPNDLSKIFKANDDGNALVITRRFPRKDPVVNRIQSNVYNLEWDFKIIKNESSCMSYQEFENGSMKLTAFERTFSLDYSGTSLSINCPDESSFYMSDFMSLSTDCISDIPSSDIAVSSDPGQAFITFSLTGGEDDGMTVFSCVAGE